MITLSTQEERGRYILEAINREARRLSRSEDDEFVCRLTPQQYADTKVVTASLPRPMSWTDIGLPDTGVFRVCLEPTRVVEIEGVELEPAYSEVVPS